MNTTIAVSPEARDKLKEFGNGGETYDDIIGKLIQSANRQLQDLLMDRKGTISIDDAREQARKRWQR